MSTTTVSRKDLKIGTTWECDWNWRFICYIGFDYIIWKDKFGPGKCSYTTMLAWIRKNKAQYI